jgi:superfamily II DNA or RNA helicase
LELLEEGLTVSEIDQLAAKLKAAGVKTLILDEAHHLRAEWWEALTRILGNLAGVNLVAHNLL